MAAHSAHLVEEPQDPWLRGYFPLGQNDVLGDRASTGLWWKDSDFLRLKDFALHLLDLEPGKLVLDLGCSNGATMVYCGLQGATVYGQDLDAGFVATANEALRRFGIQGEARCGDAVELLFPDNYFDSIVSNDFFEHITGAVKTRVLREMYRVLKPGGVAVIRTPNLAYLRLSLLYKRARAVARLRDPRKLVIPHTPGTDDPEHIGLTTRQDLTRRLVEAGFVNYQYHYPPLRRFGASYIVEVVSTELPVSRDLLCEDLVCKMFKPIALAHFPD